MSEHGGIMCIHVHSTGFKMNLSTKNLIFKLSKQWDLVDLNPKRSIALSQSHTCLVASYSYFITPPTKKRFFKAKWCRIVNCVHVLIT